MKPSFAACKQEDCPKANKCARFELGKRGILGIVYIKNYFDKPDNCGFFIPTENKRFK